MQAIGTTFSVILSLSFCHLLNDMMQSLVPALYPILKYSYNLSFSQVGLITLAFQCTGLHAATRGRLVYRPPPATLFPDRRHQLYALSASSLMSRPSPGGGHPGSLAPSKWPPERGPNEGTVRVVPIDVEVRSPASRRKIMSRDAGRMEQRFESSNAIEPLFAIHDVPAIGFCSSRKQAKPRRLLLADGLLTRFLQRDFPCQHWPSATVSRGRIRGAELPPINPLPPSFATRAAVLGRCSFTHAVCRGGDRRRPMT
jgi:hypothetical protein